MAFVLTTITPDGSKTVSGSITYGPQVVCAVSEILRRCAPWMPRRERDNAGLHVARGRKGVPLVHLATGLVFQVDTVPDWRECAADDPVAGCTPHTRCPDHTPARLASV